MTQRDEMLLAEMLDAADQAQEIARGRSSDELQADRLRRDALLWNFTVLGEAAAKVSEDVKRAHPDIPWAQPVRVRNRIVHGYWSIDLDILVVTATRDLAGFAEQLRGVRESLR